jgi:Holliday junction resolvase RusA-like endonuclease
LKKEVYKFSVPGNPQAQGRPRFFRRGNIVGTYDPQDSKDYKSRVAFFATESGLKQLEGPVSVSIDVYLKRPKNRCHKKFATGHIPCFSRPDCDNFAKGIFDALNGIAWKDDGQVQELQVRKWYHAIGGSPRTDVSMSEI